MADALFGSVQVTRTATPEELTSLMSAIGFLPQSYRTFAETDGDGLTNALILVFMPFECEAGEFISESDGLMHILEAFTGNLRKAKFVIGRGPGGDQTLGSFRG